MKTLAGFLLALSAVSAFAAEPAPFGLDFILPPKVFSLVDCWLSDSKSPVVTEISLDAVRADGNEFSAEPVTPEDGWYKSAGDEGRGFRRYRVISAKDAHYKVEYQDNGGGSLTTASIIEFSVQTRQILRGGKPHTIHVLHVISDNSE